LIDNDFSGDPDDLFQLAHHLLSPSVDVCGVIGSHLAPGDFLDPSPDSAANAVTAARSLIEAMGAGRDVPLFVGAPTALGDFSPIRSAGSEAIARFAMERSSEPLFVACGAGLTDFASALMTHPEIEERVILVWIGGPEYPDMAASPPDCPGVEYNLNIDIKAAMYVFNETRVQIWQVPRNAYRQCVVSAAELESRVRPCGALGGYLYDSIESLYGKLGKRFGRDCETYVLGDQPLVLLTALRTLFNADPASSPSVRREARMINEDGTYGGTIGGREVRVFTAVDTRLMFEDFFLKLRKHAGLGGR
jgi:inosine-uridine nucleoside N-ribohydrolase